MTMKKEFRRFGFGWRVCVARFNLIKHRVTDSAVDRVDDAISVLMIRSASVREERMKSCH